mmetsp:Transcript_103946/g.179090  ORF Transcript_103946/g.179090 Transcript_103946/m.179090 type:complete len:278 (-) Transcript_103946:264-1097(-)
MPPRPPLPPPPSDDLHQSVSSHQPPELKYTAEPRQATSITNKGASSSTAESPRKESTYEGDICSICTDALNPTNTALLPCCGRLSSTILYCKECIAVICSNGGGTGRCPTCREFITVGPQGRFRKSDATGTCRFCSQNRVLMREGVCGDCVLGARLRLHYECGRCHEAQLIAHPLFRTQTTPTEFGTTTWQCKRCRADTKWRIIPSDAPRVPAEECPLSWGRRDEWLQAVRAERKREASRYFGAAPVPQRTTKGKQRPSSASGSVGKSKNRCRCVLQ